MRKRALSLLLALALCLSLLPVSARADGEELSITIRSSVDFPGLSTSQWYKQRGNIVSATVAEGITELPANAFHTCQSLRSITLPDSLTSIGTNAFASCSALTSVIIPDGVISIGSNAFYNCTTLRSVRLPRSWNSAGGNTFYGCQSLVSVIVPDNITALPDNAFSGAQHLQAVSLPGSLLSIGSNAFHTCQSLRNITLPDTLTSIGTNAFVSCSALTSVIIPDGVTSIGSNAFYNCTALRSVRLPRSWNSAGGNTFYGCQSLVSVIVPDNITALPDNAFSGAQYLQTISLPGSLLSISSNAFHNCAALADVYFGGTEAAWNKLTVGSNNESLKNAVIHYGQYSAFSDSIAGLSIGTPRGTILREGETLQLSANGDYSSVERGYTWSSSDATVATINSSGLVKGISTGYTVITLQYTENGKKKTDQVYVVVKPFTDYDDYMYTFGNNIHSFGYQESSCAIPLARFKQLGFATLEAYCLRKAYGKWGGNCYGMSVSSILFFKNILQEEKYSPSSEPVYIPRDFRPPAGNSDSETRLRSMIELLQLSQLTDSYSVIVNSTGHLPEGYVQPKQIVLSPESASSIMEETAKGRPVVIDFDVYQSDGIGDYLLDDASGKPISNGGHTTVIYGARKETSGDYTFKIYDTSSFITTVTYSVSTGIWSTDNNKAKYIFVPKKYRTYGSLKATYDSLKKMNSNGAASLLESEETPVTCMVCPAAGSVRVTNSAGKTSVIAYGTPDGGIEGLSAVVSGFQEGVSPNMVIFAPYDAYTVEGVDSLTISNDTRYVDVEANAAVTLSADLRQVTLAGEAGTSFEVASNEFSGDYDTLTVSGAVGAGGSVTIDTSKANPTVSGADSLSASAEVSRVSTEVPTQSGAVKLGSVTLPERGQLDAPISDLPSGSYLEGQVLSFYPDGETVIYYTTDGSAPSRSNGYIYGGPIDVTRSVTVRAIATKFGYLDSEPVTYVYTLPEVAAPTADIAPGTYDHVLYAGFTAEDGATVYYTTEADEEPYIPCGMPIILTGDTTVRVCAVKNGCVSDTVEFVYRVSPREWVLLENTPLNQNGEMLTQENLASLSSLSLVYRRLNPNAGTAVFVAAFYDKDGKLVAVSSAEKAVNSDLVQVSVPFRTPPKDAASFKLFVLDKASRSVADAYSGAL